MKTDNESIAKFNVIFKPFEGEENWPHLIEMPDFKCIKVRQGAHCCIDNNCRYNDALLLSKANAIPFREKDREEVNWLCRENQFIAGWQPNLENIYSIEGKCEIIEYPLIKVSWESQEMFQDRLKNGKRIKFVMLLKEETNKEDEKEESQEDLWDDFEAMLSNYNDRKITIPSLMKSKFQITRIKNQ